MFGINKKNETEKAATQVEKKGTEDEIQFDFEEDDKLPFDDEGFDDEYAEENESAPSGLRQSLSQRKTLLALLLLIALVGAGYYYLNSTSVPPPQPAAPVKSKVAVQPVKPAPAPAVQPASPVPAAAAPAKELQPAPAVKEQAAPAVKAVAVAKTPAPIAAVATPAEVASPPATRQPFTLSAGTFVSQKNQREVEKTIRRLGYTPKVKSSFSMVPMTRLRLGVYDVATAQVRSRELSAQLPGLFAMKQGDKVALYAGSYQSLDQARSFSDQLYLRGIHVDEEPVSLRMPVKNISYGSFASRAAAEKAVKRAATAGLSAQVVKR